LVTVGRDTSFTEGIRQIDRMVPAKRQRRGRGAKPRRRIFEGGLSMRTNLLPNLLPDLLNDDLPGNALIRVLAAAALSTSALAGAALALALAAPTAARAETLTPLPMAPRTFTLPTGPSRQMGPSLAAEGEAAASLVTPLAATPRTATPHFRLEADDGAVSTIYHLRNYDLRLEYGTVFAHAPLVSGAVPGEPAASLLRRRLMSRVVTRF